MRTMTMRTGIALLGCLVFFAACGGDDGEANKAKLGALKEQHRQLNAEMAEKSAAWQTTLNAVIPAQKAWQIAKKKGDEGATAAAKEALDDAKAAAAQVSELKEALRVKIRDLGDRIRKLSPR